MLPIILTDRLCGELETLVAHTPLAKERCRAQALLWLAEGRAAHEVAALLHVSRQSVYNWVDRFRQREGLDLRARLRDAPRCGRPPTALGIIDPLIADVIDGDPRELGYRSTNWTAGLLVRYLERAHGIEVSRRSVGLAIDRLRIRWKRPRHELALRPVTWRQSKGGSSAAWRAAPAPSC
jgi:transposase